MATAREIRRRIRSVKNTGKITKAMEMVSAAKMRRAQRNTMATRPYADRMRDVMAELSTRAGRTLAHPLLDPARKCAPSRVGLDHAGSWAVRWARLKYQSYGLALHRGATRARPGDRAGDGWHAKAETSPCAHVCHWSPRSLVLAMLQR